MLSSQVQRGCSDLKLPEALYYPNRPMNAASPDTRAALGSVNSIPIPVQARTPTHALGRVILRRGNNRWYIPLAPRLMVGTGPDSVFSVRPCTSFPGANGSPQLWRLERSSSPALSRSSYGVLSVISTLRFGHSPTVRKLR